MLKRLKTPLLLLGGAVLLVGLSYFVLPSHVRQSVEVSTPQKVVPETRKETVTAQTPPIAEPSAPDSKPRAKDEKRRDSDFSIQDWIPKAEPRTWLAFLLCAIGLVVVFFGKSDHRKWGAALVVAAGALLTVPSLTSESALDGSWEATFSGFLSHIRAQTLEWGFQQWASASLIVASLIMLALTDRKVSGAAALAVAAFLLIAPPISLTGDWKGEVQKISWSWPWSSPKIETITLSKIPTEINPDPDRYSVTFKVDKGCMELLGPSVPISKQCAGQAFDQAAKGVVTQAVATTDAETVLKYQLCPATHRKPGWC